MINRLNFVCVSVCHSFGLDDSEAMAALLEAQNLSAGTGLSAAQQPAMTIVDLLQLVGAPRTVCCATVFVFGDAKLCGGRECCRSSTVIF